MNCQSCDHTLTVRSSGLALCPHCGQVNVVKVEDHKASVAFKVSSRLKFKHLNLQSLRLALAPVLLLLIVAFFSVTQNVSAQNKLSQAANLDQTGKYQQAAAVLRYRPAPMVLPGTKAKLTAETKANRQWVVFYGYQVSAEKLIKTQKYDQALALLGKIPRSYPTYSTITRHVTEVKKQQALIAQQQAKAAEAAKQAEAARAAAAAAAAKQAQAKKAAPGVSAPAAPLGCFPPQSITGKRYANTTAFGSVLAAQSVAQVQQIVQGFFSQYGMGAEITSVSPSNYAKQYSTYVTATPEDLCSLKAFSAILIDEWSKYPGDWVVSSGVKRVTIVKRLVVVGQNRAAMPDIGGSGVYYDFTYSGDYIREVIHHEYDHLIEYNAYGTYSRSDPAWMSYNPAGFAYGNGGSVCYTNPSACVSGEHPTNGFVSGYSMSGIEEDKAEVYAYLMTHTYYQHLKSWLPGDGNLANKVNAYKAFMTSRSGTMSGSYFDQINP
jgi:hypothetical protein